MANNNKNRTAPAGPAPEPVSRAQRMLLYVGGAVLGLGIIDFAVLLIGEASLGNTAAGQKQFESSQFWLTAAFLPEPAIILGFLLFIALLVVTVVRRSRASAGASK